MTTPIVPGDQPQTLASVMPVPPSTRSPVVPALIAAVAVLAVVTVVLTAFGSPLAQPEAVPSPSPVVVNTTVVVTRTVTAAPTTPTAPPPPAAPTIREGTWTVGTDIPPGTYRTTSEVGTTCYWEISRTGTNGEDTSTCPVRRSRPGRRPRAHHEGR
jgi:hypothetical protein